jgi:hypothetical protein
MQRSPAIVIQRKSNFPIFEDLLQWNEFGGHDGNQGFILYFLGQIVLVNDCQQWHDVVFFQNLFNRIDDLILLSFDLLCFLLVVLRFMLELNWLILRNVLTQEGLFLILYIRLQVEQFVLFLHDIKSFYLILILKAHYL